MKWFKRKSSLDEFVWLMSKDLKKGEHIDISFTVEGKKELELAFCEICKKKVTNYSDHVVTLHREALFGNDP